MRIFATRRCATLCPSPGMGVAAWLLAALLMASAVPAWAGSKSATYGNQDNDAGQPANSGAIAVIYPDVGEPYRSIFAQIVDGITEKTKGRASSFVVGANINASELNNSLHNQNARVVIALGRQGILAASTLGSAIGVVAGGILTVSESDVRNMQVNILSPDPALLFSRLKGTMPKARRIFVVYDPRQNEWMIRLAKHAAHAQGMELVAYEVQDLRSAMRAYQEIFAAADLRQDALWLPQDSTTVEESAVLPLVLQESWKRSIAVFSSSFGHVKRGALFSMYPDNFELGRRLAVSALGILTSGEVDTSGMTPLREVQVAVNLRTAKHLGLDGDRMDGFDMTFPER